MRVERGTDRCRPALGDDVLRAGDDRPPVRIDPQDPVLERLWRVQEPVVPRHPVRRAPGDAVAVRVDDRARVQIDLDERVVGRRAAVAAGREQPGLVRGQRQRVRAVEAARRHQHFRRAAGRLLQDCAEEDLRPVDVTVGGDDEVVGERHPVGCGQPVQDLPALRIDLGDRGAEHVRDPKGAVGRERHAVRRSREHATIGEDGILLGLRGRRPAGTEQRTGCHDARDDLALHDDSILCVVGQ